MALNVAVGRYVFSRVLSAQHRETKAQIITFYLNDRVGTSSKPNLWGTFVPKFITQSAVTDSVISLMGLCIRLMVAYKGVMWLDSSLSISRMIVRASATMQRSDPNKYCISRRNLHFRWRLQHIYTTNTEVVPNSYLLHWHSKFCTSNV